MNFLEKLDFLMDRYSLNKRTLSINSDIPYTTIDNWYKRGYEGLKLPTLRKLAEYFNTTLDYWILDEITDPNYGKSSGFKVEYNEMEHIKKYRFLTEHSPVGASVVDAVLDREHVIAQKLKEKDTRIAELETSSATIIELPTQSGTRHLAEYFHDASAGGGIFILGNEAASKIAVSDSDWDERTDYVIRVNGDSMEPDYMDGDNVMVSQRVELDHGDIGIFVVNGRAYIKEYGETELISRNPNFSNIAIHESDNIVCMGKVLGKLEGEYEIVVD